MAIGTLKDKHPHLTIAQIREGIKNKTLDPLSFEEMEALFEVLREVKEQRIVGLEEAIAEIDNWRGSLPAATTVTAEDLGLELIPTNTAPEDFPVPTAVTNLVAGKADVINTLFQPVAGVSNVFEIEYSPITPCHFIEITADSEVQLKSMHHLTGLQVPVYLWVKKASDTLTLTFKDNTTELNANKPDGVSVGANTYDVYTIQKVGNLFFIDCRPLGAGSAQEAEAQTPTLPSVQNFTVEQLEDLNGVKRVRINFDEVPGVTGETYTVVRPKTEGYAAPTLWKGDYPAGGELVDDGTIGVSVPALQSGVTYFYGVRVSKVDYQGVGFIYRSIKIV